VVGSQGVSPGKFKSPRALAVDSKTGRFYVVDRSGRIQLLEADGKFLLQWYLPEHEQGQPVGIAIEKDGNVLVNDSHYHRILRYPPDGSKILARWGSEGSGPGQFTFGRDVVVDSEGYIYAGDYGGGNDRILKFTHDGSLILEWGGCGEAPGKFQRPQGMTFEHVEHGEALLVADCANHRVQRFARDGKFLFTFGKAGGGPGELRYPHSVAVGSDGSIYVSEWGNNRVQRFDREGRSLGFWGSGGHAAGELSTPWEVAIGPGDRLYVADCGNHRVQVFQWPAKDEVHG
jgi:DNA-binding beta-propeller fold protein YncE